MSIKVKCSMQSFYNSTIPPKQAVWGASFLVKPVASVQILIVLAGDHRASHRNVHRGFGCWVSMKAPGQRSDPSVQKESQAAS